MRKSLIKLFLVFLTFSVPGPVALLAGQHEGHGGISFPEPTREFIKTGKYDGKVITVDDSSITIEVQKKDQTQTFTFQITDETKTKGSIEAGSDVRMKYRENMGQKVATSIEARKPKGKRT